MAHVDINSYFDYVDNIVNTSTINDSDKNYYKNLISLYKITGIVSFEYVDIIDDISTKDSDDELYILFELLSMRLFNILNYWAWKKREEFGII